MNPLRRVVAVEAKLFTRELGVSSTSVLLPTLILLVLGAIPATRRPDELFDGQTFLDIFCPSLVVVTIAVLAVNTMPLRFGSYREKGVLRRMSTTPVHPAYLLGAQLVVNLAAAVTAVVLLVAVGRLAFGVSLPRHPLGFVAAFAVGTAALFACGLLVAAVAPNSRAAGALAIPLYLLAMFFGGVYLPRFIMPEILVRFGDYNPAGRAGLAGRLDRRRTQPRPAGHNGGDHPRRRRAGRQGVPLGVNVTAQGDRLDAVERRAEPLLLAISAFMLLAGTVLSVSVRMPGEHSWTPVPAIIGLAVLAGAWLYGLSRLPATMTTARAASFLGLLAIMASLVYRHPLFGFFAYCGYLYVDRLPKRLSAIGVAVTAFLVASSQVGGLPPPDVGPLIYLGVIAINLVVAGGMMALAMVLQMQNERRKQMVAGLSDANRKLEAAMAENAGLHALLLNQAREAGVLDERQRLAREIHDTLAQGLTGIITQLAAADTASGTGRRRHLDTAGQLARESLSEARRSVQALRPEPLEAAHLPEALADVVNRWSEVNGVAARAVTTGTARPMHPEVEVTLLRTAQEALANVAKHAKASRVGVTLSYMEDLVTLDVRDNGMGFDVACGPADPDGFGLTAMRQRLGRVAGELEIESEPGVGTAVSARVPVP